MTEKLQSILIKPAGPDCNLHCSYCFYKKKKNYFKDIENHRMSSETLKELIRQTLSQCDDDVFFIWQGGEPTLMGLKFFKEAVELQNHYKSNHKISNAFQTNGILINNEWGDFLSKNNFLVGLSLDGPENIHNHYRSFEGGKGSFDESLKGALMLLNKNVDVNAMIVVNDYSVQFPEEIYAFHKNLGLSFMQFIPCIECIENNTSKISDFSVQSHAYGKFLCKIFDLWIDDIKDSIATTSIRFFDSIFRLYLDFPPGECTLLKTCGKYLTVEYDGSVFSCDFYVENDWHLGNIHDSKLINMLNSPKQITFGEEKSKFAKECIECKWLKLCQGGCPKDRIFHKDGEKQNYLCSALKLFFEYADEKFTDLTFDWIAQEIKNE